MKLKGSISISRPQGGASEPCISIEFRDKLSRTRFLEVEIGLAEFAEALTGMGEIPCKFDLRAKNVGKVHEHKTEEVCVSSDSYDRATREQLAAELIRPLEVDGWKGRARDAVNSHNRVKGKKDTYLVVFERFVEAKP